MMRFTKIFITLGVIMLLLRGSAPAAATVIPEANPLAPQPTPYNAKGTPEAAVPQDDFCKRPYTQDSVWNIPLDWSRANIHPDNAKMMDAFFKDSGWIGSDATQFAPNIYYVTDETPKVPVKLRQNRYRDAIDDIEVQYGQPGGVVWMPFPKGAQPAPGTDGQMVVVNLKTGEEWGINQGEVDSAGNWTVGGAYRYNINNSGIPPEGFGQRGGGIGQFAGIIRPCEIERGSIDHAVTLAYDFPCEPETCLMNGWPTSIPPFTTTDGKGVETYDIPEGARIAIRPEITMDQIRSVCNGIKGCEVWTRNMQIYGGFIVDDSGHPKTYPQGDASAHWDPAIWTSDMLQDIPQDWYVVIDWNFPSTKADK
jgi:hypothetical protein